MNNIIEKEIDIYESNIDPEILKLLLKDKTTHKNIMWCTNDYESYGSLYNEHAQIQVELITNGFSTIIQPRALKPTIVQEQRIKKRAEVFTPSWICNQQNNQIDEMWFGRRNVFNVSKGTYWITIKDKILFEDNKKNWKAYVDAKRLEITCGEAPYLVSRYDTTTGVLIPIYDRIGLFDRKMRIVNENCDNDELWLKWSLRALKSVYGYEFQGDNLLIARKNLLYDYIEYYKDRFKQKPPIDLLHTVANIIVWNLWQMDGLKFVVPYSCHETEVHDYQMSFFDTKNKEEEQTVLCPGCEKNNIFMHKGVYCRIFDWTNLKKSILFIDALKKGNNYGEI